MAIVILLTGPILGYILYYIRKNGGFSTDFDIEFNCEEGNPDIERNKVEFELPPIRNPQDQPIVTPEGELVASTLSGGHQEC
mmetsp:Transcript_15805/g.24328  ORF Transcript_15805/g.24328 Transcript_15805/m.24328 type:complete len:82 (-) Transcript_15805:93-338(-)